MDADDAELMQLFGAIVADDRPIVTSLLASSPVLTTRRAQLGATRQAARQYYLEEIAHYVYAGDTALHIAAGAYRVQIVRELLAAEAPVSASNRRGAQPLHYAADGRPGARTWNPAAQAETIERLIACGADPNARDRNGAAPLHRAIRCRCAAAVEALLAGGADPLRENNNGTAAVALATRNTGRGGAGEPAAKAEQEQILLILRPWREHAS